MAQRVPKRYRPWMRMLNQGRYPLGTVTKESTIYLFHRSPRYTFSSIGRRYRKPIDVTLPSISRTDHGTNQPPFDYRDNKNCILFTYQASQSCYRVGNTWGTHFGFDPEPEDGAEIIFVCSSNKSSEGI